MKFELFGARFINLDAIDYFEFREGDAALVEDYPDRKFDLLTIHYGAGQTEILKGEEAKKFRDMLLSRE